jgi:hypothetical protein
MPLDTKEHCSLTCDIPKYKYAGRSRLQGKSNSEELSVWSSVLDSKYPHTQTFVKTQFFCRIQKWRLSKCLRRRRRSVVGKLTAPWTVLRRNCGLFPCRSQKGFFSKAPRTVVAPLSHLFSENRGLIP